jgi:hypothetical protein
MVRARIGAAAKTVLWAAVLCCPVWLATSAIAQDKPADAIKKDIGDLTTKLKALPDALRHDDSVKQQLATLRDTIFSVDCLDPRGQLACELAKLKAAADNFNGFYTLDQKNRLTDADKANLKATLKPLIDTLATYENVDTGSLAVAISNSIDRLNTALTALNLDLASDADKRSYVASAKRLTSSASTLEKDDVVAAVQDAATHLATSLALLNSADVGDAARRDLETSIRNTSAALSSALTKLTGDLKILIRGAWYGDLEEIAWAADHGRIDAAQDGRRFCAATKTVQLWCQRQGQCTIQPGDPAHPVADSAGTITGPLSGDKLCGYDPVPYAEDRIRGLFIAYECRPNRAFTAAAREEADYGNGARSPSRSVKYFSVRRTAFGAFKCEPPQ